LNDVSSKGSVSVWPDWQKYHNLNFIPNLIENLISTISFNNNSFQMKMNVMLNFWKILVTFQNISGHTGRFPKKISHKQCWNTISILKSVFLAKKAVSQFHPLKLSESVIRHRQEGLV
jgi:hypothetical protein